jgi:hypothetical protein
MQNIKRIVQFFVAWERIHKSRLWHYTDYVNLDGVGN